MVWHQWQGDKLVLRLRVQTRAGRNEFAGLEQGRLKLRVTGPPADGKANTLLVEFLAKAFGVGRSRIVLVRGTRSRHKRVSILAPARIPAALAAHGVSLDHE